MKKQQIDPHWRESLLLVRQRSDDGPEQHGRSEAGDEEATDVSLPISILAVEVVHVRTLQPISGCLREEKGEKVKNVQNSSK